MPRSTTGAIRGGASAPFVNGSLVAFDIDAAPHARGVPGGVLGDEVDLIHAVSLHAHDGGEGPVVVHIDALPVDRQHRSRLRASVDDDQVSRGQKVDDFQGRGRGVVRGVFARAVDLELAGLREGALDVGRVDDRYPPAVVPLLKPRDCDAGRSHVGLVQQQLPEQRGAGDLEPVALAARDLGPAQRGGLRGGIVMQEDALVGRIEKRRRGKELHAADDLLAADLHPLRGRRVRLLPPVCTSAEPLCTSVRVLRVSASYATWNSALLTARAVVDSVATSWNEPATLAPGMVAETPPQFSFSRTLRTLVVGSSNSSRISSREPGLIVVIVPSK